MKTFRGVLVIAISMCFLVTFVTQVWSAEKIALQVMKPISLGMCAVSGTVKLDPNDKTNGFLHYKGNVTFKALKDLKGTNLYLNGPIYSCTCVTCPKGSSHATGLQPEGAFTAGQSKTYAVDCASWKEPISGNQGKGKIQSFTQTTPSGGGYFWWSDCAGRFTFTQ